MANLTDYAVDFQSRKAELRKVLKIRTSRFASARQFFDPIPPDIVDGTEDGPPRYFCFAYDLKDGLHVKNLVRVAENFDITIEEIRSLFPNVEEYQDGLYLFWNSLSQARIDMRKLSDRILQNQKRKAL